MLSDLRLGRVTASNAHKIHIGGKGVTRDNYIMQLAQEKWLGMQPDPFNSGYTDHGEFNEYEALEVFAEQYGFNVEYLEQKFFIMNDDAGATPDAAVVSFCGDILATVDAKCPVSTFCKQKIMMTKNISPEWQNVPFEYFCQGQHQMMSVSVATKTVVKDHYLVRYLTSAHVDEYGNKKEFNLDIKVRLLVKHIKADPDFQKMHLHEIGRVAKERDQYIEQLKQIL